MILVPADKLLRLGTGIFSAQGLSREKAEFIAETLVEASLTGHDSHGVFYIPRYSERIREGHIDPKAEPKIVKETASTALLDGRWAPGQITALKVVETAVEKAMKNAVSAVGAFNCNHIGRVGYYTNWAAEKGVVAMMFVNVGHPAVTVFNGTGKVFGTNPFSAAVPTGEVRPFLIDYATSVVAEGKITIARSKAEKIPTHWTRDRDGKVTDDPWAIKQGGWLLPFGEYKGYCLQLLNELLGAILTGSRTGLDPKKEPPSTNGVFAIALDPDAFIRLNDFKLQTDEILRQVRRVPPEPGKRVLYPGEPEWETKDRRLSEGIPLPEETWSSILELAEELGLEINLD
ncbi:MAG: Ldh family oxidoreductase [Candidatus Bathyarchaeota archaeon]|nr:MAG: Ldh family oxidoreductase [Candidatus Bathyarchaeota archaeon]